MGDFRIENVSKHYFVNVEDDVMSISSVATQCQVMILRKSLRPAVEQENLSQHDGTISG